MGRHENCRALAFHVREQLVKRFLHERVKTLGRLVQNQQRRVGLQSLDKPQFTLHAGAVFAHTPPQVAARQFQSVKKFLPALLIHWPAVEAREKVQDFEARQIRIKAQFTGQVSNLRASDKTLLPTVVTENECSAAGGPQQIKQQTDRGGLARAIQAKEAANLPLRDVQVEFVQRGKISVPLGQATNLDGGLRVRAH